MLEVCKYDGCEEYEKNKKIMHDFHILQTLTRRDKTSGDVSALDAFLMGVDYTWFRNKRRMISRLVKTTGFKAS